VIGAISWPSGEPVVDVRVGGATLEITGEAGASRRLPFDMGFLRIGD
jgi:hypothetical protein